MNKAQCKNPTGAIDGRILGLQGVSLMCCVLGAMSCAPANARAEQVVFDHPPHPSGGPAADTDFDFFGLPYWQFLADDFKLAKPATITRVNWWGFYDQDNPPAMESFQLRIYVQRQDAALPDEPFYLTVVDNPPRAATGRLLPVTVLPREYLYSSSLDKPVKLDANVDYWLEIAQIGDQSNAFRWEYSVADRTGHAFLNEDVPDWIHTIGNADLAFQLLTPEPASAVLLSAASVFMMARRRPRQALRIKVRNRSAD